MYAKATPLLGGIVIISVITLILFKINLVGLIFGFWMLMSFCSVVVNLWKVCSLNYLLNLIHFIVSLFGLAYWIHLGVKEYKKKNTWPSADLLFEIGICFFMFILSCIEVALSFMCPGKFHQQEPQWYSCAIALISIVENYWKKGRKLREDRLKSQLLNNLEDAFHDIIIICMEEPQSRNKIEFNQKLNDFTKMLSILVAQQREALIIAQQYNEKV